MKWRVHSGWYITLIYLISHSQTEVASDFKTPVELSNFQPSVSWPKVSSPTKIDIGLREH